MTMGDCRETQVCLFVVKRSEMFFPFLPDGKIVVGFHVNGRDGFLSFFREDHFVLIFI